MATPTKTEKKVPSLSINYCDSQETLDSLVSNNMINEDEPYFIPNPTPTNANNVALLGADGRILDSTKQFTPAGIGAEKKYAGLYDYTLISTNSDLNDYSACGYYGSDTVANTKTLSNCPVTGVFTMWVYSSDITGTDALGTTAQCYRVQRLMTVEGTQYIRHLYTNSSKNIVASTWKKILMNNDWPSLKAEITPSTIGADPVGAGLYNGFTDISENGDLNDYTACGYYRCTSDTKAATLSNSPDKYGFILIVSNPLGYYNHGSIDGVVYTHRLQRMITYKGREFTRLIVTNASGEATYNDWREMAYTDGTVAIAKKIQDYNNSSIAIQVGWAGDSLDSSTLYKLAGYTNDGKIKETTTAAALNLLGIESGTWTPTVAGASSYSTQAGQYTKIGNMVILSFQVYGVFSGSTSSRFKITGVPYNPTTSNHASGGGHISGYTVSAATDVFTGWNIQQDGNIFAVGQHAGGTAGRNKWGDAIIYQKASGDFMASGTLAFTIAT